MLHCSGLDTWRRLSSKFRFVPSGCWEWTGSLDVDGYGRFSIGAKKFRAHRAVYAELVGEIPVGLEIDHLCRNRACCNPLHMEAVTGAVNSSWKVGRWKAGRCLAGHALTGGAVYTYVTKSGRVMRSCVICRKTRQNVPVCAEVLG